MFAQDATKTVSVRLNESMLFSLLSLLLFTVF